MVRKKNKKQVADEVTLEKRVQRHAVDKVNGQSIGKAIHNQIEYHMKEIRGLRLFSLIVIIMLIVAVGIAVYMYRLNLFVTEQYCNNDLYLRNITGYVSSYRSHVDIIGPDGGSIECEYGYNNHADDLVIGQSHGGLD